MRRHERHHRQAIMEELQKEQGTLSLDRNVEPSQLDPMRPKQRGGHDEQFQNKCRILETCKKDIPKETTDLNRLIERAHLGDYKMRSKVLSQIENKLRYVEND